MVWPGPRPLLLSRHFPSGGLKIDARPRTLCCCSLGFALCTGALSIAGLVPCWWVSSPRKVGSNNCPGPSGPAGHSAWRWARAAVPTPGLWGGALLGQRDQGPVIKGPVIKAPKAPVAGLRRVLPVEPCSALAVGPRTGWTELGGVFPVGGARGRQLEALPSWRCLAAATKLPARAVRPLLKMPISSGSTTFWAAWLVGGDGFKL